MRKIKLKACILTVMLFTTACSTKTADYKTKSLYDKGLELVQQVDMLAENEEYSSLMTASPQINDTVKSIGTQDYSSPNEVYEITGFDTAYLKIIKEQTGTDLSDEIEDIVKDRFSMTLMSQINSLNGAEFLATSSILSVGDTFLYSGLTQQKTYLYLYDGDYAGMVCFIPSEEDIVSATANVIVKQQFADAATEEDIASVVEEIVGIEGITVTLVTK